MSKSNERILTIADLWNLCISRWRWFAASVIICLLLAVFHLMTTPYLYSRSASVMVREDAIGSNATDKNSRDFSEIGFVKQKSKVSDLVRHITSLDVLMEVAKRMDDSISEPEAFVMAEGIQSRLAVESESAESNIINLTYKDSSTMQAERVLLLILNVYNEKWIYDKQTMIKSTSRFIDSKLEILERELSVVDDSISSYKSRYGITELENVSKVYLEQQSQADADILKLMNQKAMAQYIRSLLENEESQQQLLLVNSGINNTLIESQITLYNNLLLQMQSHMEYTSGQNPLIMNLEKELNSLRKNILSNVINHIRTIDIQLQSLSDYHSETASKISSNPQQAKYLISIEREQKVKESLYLYLLQKKEENEISLTYQFAPIQIIDLPHGSGKPTSPKRIRVLFASLLFGILIPLSFIFFRAVLDEHVNDKFDIEGQSGINFLGEVPLTRRSTYFFLLECIRYFKKKDADRPVIVKDGSLDHVNEAFRILRTRLEAVNSPDKHVYLVTSPESGTGKTFVAMNLALTLAITGKRVLFIDGDLRKGSASRIWKTPSHGLSDYLAGQVTEFKYIFFQPEGFPSLDVLPSGMIPNNPTELLDGERLGELIGVLRNKYDYIVIDTPRSNNLADAEILGKYADYSLYVMRAGVFKRTNLDKLREDDGQLKRQYVILNGVQLERYGELYARDSEHSKKS